MPRPARHVAVFGDVHGHLRLMFQLCRLWQKEHRSHLDAILQCGDLNFFPDPARADRATRRHAKRDPEQLAFAKYFALPFPPEKDSLLERTLKGPAESLDTVRCPVIWCRGNHEDFDELERTVGSAPLAPVDAFGRLHLLRCGHITEVAGIRIAAVGGAPETETRNGRRRVSKDACGQLLEQGKDSFDVLVTHGSPKAIGGVTDQWGSDLLRKVDEACWPAYHFCAHHAQRVAPGRVGGTRCYWLNDVNFERSAGATVSFGALEAGCMGILSWADRDGHRFEVLQQPWLKEVTWSTWRQF